MNVDVHVSMDMAGDTFAFMANLDRTVDNLGIDMADAAVAGAVHNDGPVGRGARLNDLSGA